MVWNFIKVLILIALVALAVSGIYQGLTLGQVNVSVDSPVYVLTLMGIINGFALAILAIFAATKL